ncbi:MAG: TonB-dependent receptor [Acidobacteriota bacterium]|nr:TonB-dependent receptor [Acidobacteriota bacterium]
MQFLKTSIEVIGALLVLLVFVVPASAQVGARGGIAGTVQDASGARVASVRVSLVNAQQLILGNTESDATGRFSFSDVPPGTYEVRTARAGFRDRRVPVLVTAGGEANVTVVLEVNVLVEEVTITAETGRVEGTDRVVQRVNVISDDAIRTRATAVLAQVADEEVGVALQRTSPTIGAVVVRGLTEVGVYVDGVRFTQSTQRGGINTFFNLNEPSSLRAVEILRGTNGAQYGSDSLGGTLQLVSRTPELSADEPELHGEVNTFFTGADLSFGGNTLLTYGTRRLGLLANVNSRRVNTLRPAGGINSHAAVTRFLGIPSNIFGDRLPDTAFTQYGGTLHLTYAPRDDQQLNFRYQRSQQDGGKRYDQLLGGDGNLIADLRNLMFDFFYARYAKQTIGFFDNFSATFSFNNQREERVNQGGQGDPLASITNDRERTSTFGFNFYLDKQTGNNSFLVGGDVYHDKVDALSFSTDPAAGVVTLVRPRVPDGARYILAGLFVQDTYDVVHERLRLSGALRYNVASYRARAADSPLVNSLPLFPDDSLRVDDFSGRVGIVGTIADGMNVTFNFSRGFRAPNVTSLGSLGLVGVGFQVAAADVANLSAVIGSTADEAAVSTGVHVAPLRSETTNNFDLGFRLRRGRVDTDLTGYLIDYNDTIVRQTLILPPGAIGLQLGGERVERQNANGPVFVPLSPNPVLVQANFNATRLYGIEYTLDLRLTESLTFGGNYSFVRAEDKDTGEPPNLGGGGVPPQLGFLRLRYRPANSRYFLEAYSTLAGRQDRLSTLDLADRRTGATRSRTNIQNFFRRGARVRGLVNNGADGVANNADDILIPTGETLAQVQTRILGGANSASLFTAIPGYGLINLRGGFRFNENNDLDFDFENIADKSHRNPGWGVDGPGRSVSIRYRYRF